MYGLSSFARVATGAGGPAALDLTHGARAPPARSPDKRPPARCSPRSPGCSRAGTAAPRRGRDSRPSGWLPRLPDARSFHKSRRYPRFGNAGSAWTRNFVPRRTIATRVRNSPSRLTRPGRHNPSRNTWRRCRRHGGAPPPRPRASGRGRHNVGSTRHVVPGIVERPVAETRREMLRSAERVRARGQRFAPVSRRGLRRPAGRTDRPPNRAGRKGPGSIPCRSRYSTRTWSWVLACTASWPMKPMISSRRCSSRTYSRVSDSNVQNHRSAVGKKRFNAVTVWEP